MRTLSFQTKVIALTPVLIAAVCIGNTLLLLSFDASNDRIRPQHDLDAHLAFKAEALAKPLRGLDQEEIARCLRVMSAHARIADIGVWTAFGDDTAPFAEEQIPIDEGMFSDA